MVISHPDSYTEGVRLLLLASRPKDGAPKARRTTRVSNNSKHFHLMLEELNKMKEPNDRIYVSLSQRDILKASRLFRHKLVEADYGPTPKDFYKNIHNHWVSCLMVKESTLKEDKLWMFDCDSQVEYQDLWVALFDLQIPIHYQYATKNGVHVVVKPFNRTLIDKRYLDILSDNPLILWSY